MSQKKSCKRATARERDRERELREREKHTRMHRQQALGDKHCIL